MPPRASLTSSFSVADANNEVVCPLRNNDGSSCRKRCLGEKRYRSMQEHIRRAHPEHYISKLPATEESFLLMINTPPHERPPPPPPPPPHASQNIAPGYARDASALYNDDIDRNAPRSSDEYRRSSILPAVSAAAALAQLHNHRPDQGWDSEQDAQSDGEQKDAEGRNFFSSRAFNPRPGDAKLFNSNRTRELLPSSLARSPPGRSSTLPPGHRLSKSGKPRKSGLSQSARKAKHERTKSRDHSRRMSHDRKAFSAEPPAMATALGKRWEDLIDAAASATEEDSRDLTPVPTSPNMSNRASLPPYMANQFSGYAASPLQKTLTPPPQPEHGEMLPFPSVESSVESSISAQSGANFHMRARGLSDASSIQVNKGPTHLAPFQPHLLHSHSQVQIYCAMCRRLAILKDCYACPECICGLCQDCVDVLVGEQTARGRIARCPKCGVVGGKFKPFQLDIR